MAALRAFGQLDDEGCSPARLALAPDLAVHGFDHPLDDGQGDGDLFQIVVTFLRPNAHNDSYRRSTARGVSRKPYIVSS